MELMDLTLSNCSNSFVILLIVFLASSEKRPFLGKSSTKSGVLYLFVKS